MNNFFKEQGIKMSANVSATATEEQIIQATSEPIVEEVERPKLILSSKDAEIVNKIMPRLYQVEKVPLYPHTHKDDGTGEGNMIPTHYGNPNIFATYKISDSTDKPCLGTIKNNFQPMDMTIMFEAFVQNLKDSKVDLSTLTFKEYGYGEKFQFRVQIGTMDFTNLRGLQDVTKVFLVLESGFDGGTATNLFIETYRMVCKNGMRNNVRDFIYKAKNTANNHAKTYDYLQGIHKLVGKISSLDDLYNRLNNKQVNEAYIKEYLMKLANVKDKNKISTRTQNIMDVIREQIEIEIQDCGGNLFALFNGVTRYTNHVAPNHEKDTFIQYDNGAKLNDLAFSLVQKELITSN